ncbi:hypothetical protein [Maritimibacter fusiformis]|uniref:Uncharacterized protein n=1 Tax=Maritimibacter fusiformis TaxID=2603819 RepID=A0A5D0RJW6_9RHOB|nr:hypothetical protein [Maritimibacter fusiformis]TYB80988.1 hypothetical protein FVF75_11095 [Maritimibacter fusiformis]
MNFENKNGSLPLHRRKNIFAELDQALRLSGFVGDTSLPRLLWLAFHTKDFERPVSVAVLGPSGAGKSFALKAAQKFVPDDWYETIHAMSEKALVYSPLDLKHRFLVIQEAAGMAKGEGRTLLRQLLTEGELNYVTVDSVDGELGGKHLRREGPTGVMMTTTAASLHPEDASRMFCFNFSDDPEQARAILRTQASARKPKLSEDVLEAWKNFSAQALSRKVDVIIPFAEDLADAVPVTHLRIRRDFEQVLKLIETSARLHRSNRERADNGAYIATIEDYAHVFDLVARPLSEGIEATVPQGVVDVVRAVEELARTESALVCSGISQKDVAQHIGRDKSFVSRNVEVALSHGFLEDWNYGKGRVSDLRVGHAALPSNETVLPRPESLK